jgi:nitrous oxide reductase accessory protein NosL
MPTANQPMKKPLAKNLLLGALLMLALVAVGNPTQAAAQPDPLVITDAMSCGVCGMHPAKFGKWQTQVIFTDGVMVPFDGGKDLFKYILDMGKYEAKHTRADIAAIWVRDFATGAWLAGETAAYVVASQVMGPMGKELIPFSNDEAAGKFTAANGGMIKHFSAITLADLNQLGMGGMGGMGGMMKKGKM